MHIISYNIPRYRYQSTMERKQNNPYLRDANQSRKRPRDDVNYHSTNTETDRHHDDSHNPMVERKTIGRTTTILSATNPNALSLPNNGIGNQPHTAAALDHLPSQPPPLPTQRPRIHNPYLKSKPHTTTTHSVSGTHDSKATSTNPISHPRSKVHSNPPVGQQPSLKSMATQQIPIATSTTTIDGDPNSTILQNPILSSTRLPDATATTSSAITITTASISSMDNTKTGIPSSSVMDPPSKSASTILMPHTAATTTRYHSSRINLIQRDENNTPSSRNKGQPETVQIEKPQTPTQTPKAQRPELPGEALLPPELVYDPAVLQQPIKDQYRCQLTFHAQLNQPLQNGWTLFGHQKRAILKGLMKRRLILALDMGLGKTVIGCVWAKAFQNTFPCLKVIVVCPTTLVSEWKRTAETVTGLKVEGSTSSSSSNQSDPSSSKSYVKTKKKTTKKTTSKVTEVHDVDKEEENDRIEDGSSSSSSHLDIQVTTWQKIPTAVDPRIQHYVVIFDEAHMMQSMEANRTQAALTLVNAKKDRRCVGTLLLTGTPMKNGKPSNLFPLLKAVQHPLGNHQRAYEKHFCDGRMIHRSFGGGGGGGGIPTWVANGQSNLKQLHRLIEPKLLYMTKDEYLTSLPPMSQETRNVPVSASFQKQYIEKIKLLAKLKDTMKTSTNHTLSSESILGAISEVRLVCALAKIHATTEIAKEILEVEPSIVIFATYQLCVQQIAKSLSECGYPVAFITGQTSPKERQRLVDGFQKELYSAFVTTFGVGGVGITLTKARTVLLLDRPWTPGELLQAQDRIRRIGQLFPTRCISVSAFELDVQLDQMLNEKNHASTTVLTNQASATSAASSSAAAQSTNGGKINIDHLAACLISKANLFESR